MAAPAARRRARRHAHRVSRDRPGTHLLAPADRGDPGHARSRRAGHHPAQPPRLLDRRHVPQLRRKDRVRKLRHLDDLSQDASARTTAIAQPGQRLECHYCGFSPHRAEDLPEVRERASLFSRRRLAARRRTPAGALPPRAHRPHGPRHRPRPQRHGAPAHAPALAARSTCSSARR